MRVVILHRKSIVNQLAEFPRDRSWSTGKVTWHSCKPCADGINIGIIPCTFIYKRRSKPPSHDYTTFRTCKSFSLQQESSISKCTPINQSCVWMTERRVLTLDGYKESARVFLCVLSTVNTFSLVSNVEFNFELVFESYTRVQRCLVSALMMTRSYRLKTFQK